MTDESTRSNLYDICVLIGRDPAFADMNDSGLKTITEALLALARANAELRDRVAKLERWKKREQSS